MTVYLPCAVASFLGHGCKKTFFFFKLQWKNKLIASSSHSLLASKNSCYPQRGGTYDPENIGNRSLGFERSHYAGIKHRRFCCFLAWYSLQGW